MENNYHQIHQTIIEKRLLKKEIPKAFDIVLSAQWPKRSAQLDPFYPRARGPWPTCALREPRPRAPGHNLGLDRECAFPPGPNTARPVPASPGRRI